MAVLPTKNTAGGLPQRCHSYECVTDCIVTFSSRKIIPANLLFNPSTYRKMCDRKALRDSLMRQIGTDVMQGADLVSADCRGRPCVGPCFVGGALRNTN